MIQERIDKLKPYFRGLKVADNYNNLTSESVVFVTGNDNKLNISGVMNFALSQSGSNLIQIRLGVS